MDELEKELLMILGSFIAGVLGHRYLWINKKKFISSEKGGKK